MKKTLIIISIILAGCSSEKNQQQPTKTKETSAKIFVSHDGYFWYEAIEYKVEATNNKNKMNVFLLIGYSIKKK